MDWESKKVQREEANIKKEPSTIMIRGMRERKGVVVFMIIEYKNKNWLD